ncbi:hypothetical protein [Amycolatopsis sp. BJA-103]|uniref:hypothetical protein n=1 Tax=Amycolatopsis sp. BJA-103 TaxID=1911175 RepID=UPI000C7776FB|nr:hypothetical protein [Amycolatopsis sp. BJA-103]AUI56806.1 hypothetical protein BKN51_00315 [Amycolatopsis sp. BJA-103]PNE13449.1 hypothetical protein B1H26_40185 [Amycolatopsis sp. BJA-103]
MVDGFVFYRYRAGNPPYRRTPAGRYEQYRPHRGGWTACKQDSKGLSRLSWFFLPADAKKNAYARALDTPSEASRG